jgi:hypothetical protein
MKPVNINLAVKKNIQGKISLGLAAVFLLAACGFIMVNIYDYNANTKVIKIYEARLKTINKRSEQQRVNARKININREGDKKNRQDLNYLKAIIKKNMFPLSELLTQIERVKPDKIDIKALIFSDNLKTVIISGASGHVAEVSDFIAGMGKSKSFAIELSKEEINENSRIIFELTAKWIAI